MTGTMAHSNCTKVACRMPLHYIFKWTPFHIDALGIVTMIGAEQINQLVGRLVATRYSEYLPLLGAYVIASNSFTEAYSGFNLFNIPAGIMTTDIAGWFSRWCLAQDFSRGCSSVTWTVEGNWSLDKRARRKRQSRFDTSIAILIGIVLNGYLLAFTALQGDWWGLANALSMVVSIIVRWYVTKKNRDAIDDVVTEYYNPNETTAKCFVAFNDGKQINMYAPSSLVRPLFSDKPSVKDNYLSWYFAARMAGWIGFAAHVITIGQAGLATQIITVFIIVVSTMVTVFKVGCDDSYVGSKLHAKITRPGPGESTRRQDAFIHLDLNKAEERLMRKWGQMPLRHDTDDNKRWWEEYEIKKAIYIGRALPDRPKQQALQPTQPPSAPQPRLPTNSIPPPNMALKVPTITATARSFSSGSDGSTGA